MLNMLTAGLQVACGTENGDGSTEQGDMNDTLTDASIVEFDGGEESDGTVVTEAPEKLPPSTACDVIEEIGLHNGQSTNKP